MDAIYLQLFSVHGLLRGHDLELGRNADSGGQLKYVTELIRSVSAMPEIRKVDLFTRIISDKAYSPDYAEPVERLNEKARLVRIQCGGRKYMRKEKLWPHLDEYVDRTLRFIKKENDTPDMVHGHYADGGYVAGELSALFGIPFVFTGHSLGIPKKQRLAGEGLSENDMNRRFRIDHRIGVEEDVISRADIIVASTHQEVEEQYRLYATGGTDRFRVIPPGIDIGRFRPFYNDADGVGDPAERERINEARFHMEKELERFLREPAKPLILALSRPDRRKNIAGLITAYGSDRDLRMMANLAVFAGIRRDINEADENEREVLTELLLLMDKYDLYGRMAIPKRHDFEYEVPELYRIAAATEGVFVNSAFTEPFGLTLIEAAASGLPIVAPNDGGPRDILRNCSNGKLVDPGNTDEIAENIKALLADHSLWRKCSKNGVLGVQRRYTWNGHCRRYLDVLNSMPLETSPDFKAGDTPEKIGRRLTGLDRLFVTDVDNTLIGDEKALETLVRVLKDNRGSLGFGVASGRTPEDALEVLRENDVPDPDLLIGSVGTEIYYGGLIRIDKGWHTHISVQWDRERIREALSKLSFLEEQPEEAQRQFKISYYLDQKNSGENLSRIHALLGDAGLKYNAVYSGGKHLDILPYRASKGKAMRYLLYKWSIQADQTLVAGDSGNDADMLRGGVLGVVVANHQPELENLRKLRGVYFASKRCAGGILEGFRKYGFIFGAPQAEEEDPVQQDVST